MIRTASPLVEQESRAYGQTTDSFRVTFPEAGRNQPCGALTVRFHGAGRASVSDAERDGIRCGAHRYRVHATYVRTPAGWTLEEAPGLPPVYRADELWTRPAPTIDAKLRSAALGAVTVVANLWPDATTAAEVDRLTREHGSARATVRRLRAELAEAVAAERDAAELLAYAGPDTR